MNQREMDVLEILWGTQAALMVTEIVQQQRGLTQSTVTAVLRKLLNEGLVEVTGISHSGRVLSRVYRPTERSRKCVLEYFQQEYCRVRHIITSDELCDAIMEKDRSESREVEQCQ